jgi:hypothetical protein
MSRQDDDRPFCKLLAIQRQRFESARCRVAPWRLTVAVQRFGTPHTRAPAFENTASPAPATKQVNCQPAPDTIAEGSLENLWVFSLSLVQVIRPAPPLQLGGL